MIGDDPIPDSTHARDSGNLVLEEGTTDLSCFGAWICEILANAGHHSHRTRLVRLLKAGGIQIPDRL